LRKRYYKREELVGKDVYDGRAKKVGPVSDMGYSKDGKVALIVGNKTILFEKISKIGDIILLKGGLMTRATLSPAFVPPSKDVVAPPPSEKVVEPASEKLCPKCNKRNVKSAKFCVKCGYKF
jgi:sporulation protein YlmC with PRC-barrel domain